ncbi:MAG: insulinase family protein [Streptococcus pyogenes]|nr:MAG: insulinase family protein [Streptococcus pyogenes]
MVKLTQRFFSIINEEIISAKLANGMTVQFIPKKAYSEKLAILSVAFGSLDNIFTYYRKRRSYPTGIAHFLEHKLFEDEDGKDFTLKFTEIGSDVNAFTTFDKTSFVMSTSGDFYQSLLLLLKLVNTAHFTQDSIDREKKIIAQEIDMYLDDPDFRLYSGMLGNLFPQTSLAEDIAGSKTSIEKISPEFLLENYHLFYRPSQMNMIIIGDLNPSELFSQLESFEQQFEKKRRATITRESITYHPVITTSSISMEVSFPKLAIGYRGKPLGDDISLLTYKLALRLLLNMLFGWTSKTYQAWYEEGKVDDSFTVEIEVQQEFIFLMITLDSNQPIAMSSNIRKKIKHYQRAEDVNEQHLELVKKELYGDFIQSLDNIEELGSQFNLYFSEDESYYDLPSVLQSLTLKHVIAAGEHFFKNAETSDFTVFPK